MPLAERLRSQLLSGPAAGDAVQVVGHLLAVQAQDPRGARLAVRARTSGLRATAVDAALSTDRSLVVSWLNRGTLHLVASEDYWWLHPLTTPQLYAASTRRLQQEEVTAAHAERGVAAVERALAAEGPLTRSQLREHVAAAGVRVEGQALVHVLLLATLRGLVLRGPVVGAEQAFALVRDWLGPAPRQPDRDVALTELARRYLSGHGPATDRDLARWANLPLGDVRRGLRGLGRALVDRGDSLVSLAGAPGGDRLPPPRLLGAFDPLLHGWVSREPVLGTRRGVVTSNGVFRPFALVDGRAVGLWSIAGGAVVLRPFASLPVEAAAALEADAADVRRFLGLPGSPTRWE